MQQSQVIQITSIEPAQPILPTLVEIANRYELDVEIAETVAFNAPFCGDEYFAQEIRMHPASGDISISRLEECLQRIETMVDQELAEGYVETA